VGRTTEMKIERMSFYNPREIFDNVKNKVNEAGIAGEKIDYLTFVPNGETSLDENLGVEINMLQGLNIKIAIISNASLIWREDVRSDFSKADCVSLKIDSTDEETWRQINRPHGKLNLEMILDGILEFAADYNGRLITETMLVKGINDSSVHAEGVAEFLKKLKPACSYISIPIRPALEKSVQLPTEDVINMFYQTFKSRIKNVEYLIGYEGNEFASTGIVEDDILSITSVHPMREDAVKEFLSAAGAEWPVISSLIEQDKLIETTYNNQKFYLRKAPTRFVSERDL
jgi:wyosine [tRNA(Phe)-imidazoG37] synthetase (radical SAM superfamily)